ncbi:MAG: hypothetical protein J6C26_05690 [Clostridia bacterium]|nr:hypothetical protein [Clostridia bacterium]
MKKLVLFLLLATLLCSPGLVGFASESSYEEYMSKERSLSDISPTDYCKQWVSNPFVMREGVISDFQQEYAGINIKVGNVYQERIVDGKTQLVCLAEGNFENQNSSGKYMYLSTGSTIQQLDLTTLKSTVVYTGEHPIDELCVFEDIIYFTSAGSIYRYYAPDGSSELLYTVESLRGFSPLSNYIIRLSEDNPDYWEAVAASGVKEGELLKDREAFSKWMNEKFGLQTSPESKPFLYCDVENILMVCGVSRAKLSWYNTKTKELYTSSKEAKAVAPIAFAETSDESLFEDLMLQIPSYAHTGEKESILTVSTGDIINQSTSSIFFYGLQRDGLIPKTVEPFNAPPTKEQLAACPKVSAADIEKTFTRLFGPDAVARFCGKDSYSTRGHLILTRLEDGSYAYYDYSFGGGDGPGAWTNYVRSETVGEDIVLYATFAYGTLGGYDSCWISETVDDGGKALLSVPKENLEKRAADPFKMLKTGAFDEYLPIYKHTFKPNGDGTYYWAHTELDTAGKEIPLSLIEEEEQYLHSLVTTVPKEAYRGSVTTPNYQSHSKLTSSQLYEDKLYISESYAEWTVEGTSLTLYSPRGNKANADKQIVLGTWENVSPDKNQASIEGLIRDEKFVQYYTNYRHTFVKNAYGSYSWVETIVNRYGETMPVALTGGSSNSNTDSTASTTYTATDVSTGTVTDAVPDVSTGTATDVVQQEESSSAVWIVVAVVVVAAVAVGAVLLWNKKK